MFKFLQKLMIGIVIFLGTAAVAIIGAIGGFLYFAYDQVIEIVVNFFKEIKLDNIDEFIKEIENVMTENNNLIQNQIGLGMFIGGVVVLGGIVVFGILAAIFGKKNRK